MRKAGVWLELVYLVVPTLNDTDEEFRDLARWIIAYLGADVPVHFSRFHPDYLLKNLPPTPQETLEKAHAICRAEGMQFVYLGNLPGHQAESTYCPYDDSRLIHRVGHRIVQNNLTEDGRCPSCGEQIPGVWM